MQSIGGNGFSNIKDLIKQFGGKDVNQIENDAGTLLYYLPENMEQFIATVSEVRQGFDREHIEEFVDKVYEEQYHQAFKIQFNFGVIYEEYKSDQNDQVQVDYGYILPRDTRIQEHASKVIQFEEDIEEFNQYIKSAIINMQSYIIDSTKQRFIAIYSMMIKTYNLQPQIVGASTKELIDFHCGGRKNVIYKNTGNNNICYMEAVAKALHPDTKEKRYKSESIISIRREYLVQILELPFDSKSRKMTDLLKTFDGLDITKCANIVSQKLKINQDIYYYDNKHKNYYGGLQVMYQDEIADQNKTTLHQEIKTSGILVVESEQENNKITHAFAITNKQALTGLKFCPHCNSKAFDPKDKNYSRDYEKHIIKCENNEGKIEKKVKLDYIQKPFVPHIMQNKTHQYLLANGRQHEFKPTQYFITYDLETVPKIINKKFGKSSYQMYELFPLSVASTVRSKQEAEQVNADNQYLTAAGIKDKTIPYSMEVPIQAAKDFGDGYDDKIGLFPYEVFNTDNVNEVLSKSEPFTMEDFNSSLKKTKISQKDYQIYLEDAKRFKNRWDYLQYYNEQDIYIMIKPLMTLMSLQFKYRIDMFSFMSMAACSNAIKYAKAYEDFDTNGVYLNFEDLSQKFYLTENYWQSKVRGYESQDKHQRRDTINNVQDSDFDYFKQLFKDSNCSICGRKFTFANKPTLDRIDNLKCHSKDNVQPCCLYCNCFCSNKDKNIGKLFIQLRKYCMIRC
ncbi:MAG: hypothetical protein EZS28_016620 [Streblomastix strix]|uniref:Uncharacterized protein n=1 Tax=Streblomastix strix TaxID=222440 RepID=A0A5J4VYW0_9EUKA|nr:MAG: hypothetical protein EZS28_016620 [Streblomastix strix]